jgi:hypothetical protein
MRKAACLAFRAELKLFSVPVAIASCKLSQPRIPHSHRAHMGPMCAHGAPGAAAEEKSARRGRLKRSTLISCSCRLFSSAFFSAHRICTTYSLPCNSQLVPGKPVYLPHRKACRYNFGTCTRPQPGLTMPTTPSRVARALEPQPMQAMFLSSKNLVGLTPF